MNAEGVWKDWSGRRAELGVLGNTRQRAGLAALLLGMAGRVLTDPLDADQHTWRKGMRRRYCRTDDGQGSQEQREA